ncbi:2-amino-4-hydroxy-6-hydroxymethyldihydropteridine diphosphokinase [Marinobacter zhejiangensis]|uniref:2-amino-4-hydroxy-6-hydroxymethyldihydropteridine diphosphokinase n=1 Tax=Marinobacter zhejiangensis TaxID=488535 RepID=A0A1I4MI65_9GAMM|nr:2-amino-4-hydroxy-6-hydroxymethyldihydropteridine diphosphokinase [Marinobacter zhejiangensis]SFM02786.1 2-amino-4-hydroxy-6-hydroxymethyldihydropteridinediphosphokinase [Marinobacter zhejiangensis]
MSKRVPVYISIGSNIDRERHIGKALDALADEFGELEISSVYESEAVGFDGEPFLNLVVAIQSDKSVAELSKLFKGIEAANGRVRNAPKFSPRTLDLDILTYGDKAGVIDGVELPRAEILKNAFVLLPLAEIAPDHLHPVANQSYDELWRSYRSNQKLWVVPFSWRGEAISPRP